MILQTAIEHYGVESQLNKVEEELKELLEAIENWRNDKSKLPEVIDEIPDVRITMAQLIKIIEIDEPNINYMLFAVEEFKLDRLKQRIEDDKNRTGV